jgi:hypothetical protein
MLLPAMPGFADETTRAVEVETCKGWGLTTPLFGVSNRDFADADSVVRDTVLVQGPIQSGLGGGYFSSFVSDRECKTFALGWEAFAFSEGLNPGDKFQVGAAAGLSLNVWGKFSFGLALGVDLMRREKYTRAGGDIFVNNGLLILNDGEFGKDPLLNNLTVMITFNIFNTSSKGDETDQ